MDGTYRRRHRYRDRHGSSRPCRPLRSPAPRLLYVVRESRISVRPPVADGPRGHRCHAHRQPDLCGGIVQGEARLASGAGCLPTRLRAPPCDLSADVGGLGRADLAERFETAVVARYTQPVHHAHRAGRCGVHERIGGCGPHASGRGLRSALRVRCLLLHSIPVRSALADGGPERRRNARGSGQLGVRSEHLRPLHVRRRMP